MFSSNSLPAEIIIICALLTRARQGIVIVVPSGDSEDHTRSPEFYDTTYEYLKDIGFTEI